MSLDDVVGRIKSLPDPDRAELERLLLIDAPKWVPNPGAQTDAYLHGADIMLYGGAANGGKSDLILGLALTQHRRSLILRRKYVDLSALTERAIAINGTSDGFNGSPPPKLRTTDGRLIEFGAANRPGDEQSWQGRPHDLLAFDEAAQFTEAQIRFLLTWNRPIEEGVRARCVLGSNPPVTADGQWLISMFRPWLDPVHHNPAKHGELRWFVTDPDGNDMEVPDNTPIQFPGEREPVIPRSRTFVPASYKDNPLSASTNYKATLDSLPEPLRSAMRDGNFMIGRMDAERQVIPSAWIMEAQSRWTPKPPDDIPMTAMGIDPAAGGKDDTVLAPRHDWWFAPVLKKPGKDTPFPIDVLNFALLNLKNQAKLIVDCSGGYGGGVVEPARTHHGLTVVPFKGAEKTLLRTRDRQFGFRNKRAASLWAFREALDPSQEGGSPIALPPDPELLADLSAPTFEVTPGGILIEDKDAIRTRIGRSTGKGDAVTMSWWTNGAAATFAQAGTSPPRPRGWTPRVVLGHQGVRRLAGR